MGLHARAYPEDDGPPVAMGRLVLVWIASGLVGGHRFYLGQDQAGAAMLATFLLAGVLSLTYFPAAYVTGGWLFLGLGLWTLGDGLRLGALARRARRGRAAARRAPDNGDWLVEPERAGLLPELRSLARARRLQRLGGLAGLHSFYVGQIFSGAATLVLCAVGVVMLVGIVTAGYTSLLFPLLALVMVMALKQRTEASALRAQVIDANRDVYRRIGIEVGPLGPVVPAPDPLEPSRVRPEPVARSSIGMEV